MPWAPYVTHELSDPGRPSEHMQMRSGGHRTHCGPSAAGPPGEAGALLVRCSLPEEETPFLHTELLSPCQALSLGAEPAKRRGLLEFVQRCQVSSRGPVCLGHFPGQATMSRPAGQEEMPSSPPPPPSGLALASEPPQSNGTHFCTSSSTNPCHHDTGPPIPCP